MKNEFAKIKDAFSKLNFILTGEQKKYSIVVFILSIISALLEMLGVSIIYPLLQAFLNPEGLLNEPYIRPFAQALHLNSYRQVICLVCVAIIVLYILKNAYGVFFVWVSNKYAYKIQRELSVRILVAYMKQGYGFFSENSSARLLRGLGADVSSVYFIINQTFGLLSKVFTIIGIAVLIIIVTPSLSLFLLLLVAFCFILTQLIFRKSMKKYGMLAREYNYKCNQASLEAIQGSKEVLVTNRQDYFINQYQKCMEGSNRASIKNAIGAAAPAYLIEAICVSGLMIVVAVQALSSNEIASMLSQLSVIAVAAFRILPSLGAVLSAVNSIVYHAPALGAAYDTLYMVKELEKQEENEEKIEEQELANIKFQNELVISNITFKYPSRDVNVLEKLNLKIKKGTSVAFIGASGAGKTTLADIILNLLKPQQ
ncbi:MAG: ABC transporter transmembrane domain-containing protein, partial [Roseburia sp.]